jgi:hypothetical protein
MRNDHETTATRPAAPLRNDRETTTACPVCATTFTPTGRQQYCTPACRQAAWRARNTENTTPATITIPASTSRRDITVYECPDCATRRFAEQWCPDCNRPCTRIDIGGLCPHCLLTELPGVF